MSKIDQAFKEAWQWTESTEPDAITAENVNTAYRLHLKGCKLWKCKRNCKQNPHCLSGLGEKIWQEDVKLEEKDEAEDLCNTVRKNGEFVGLTNLGATCYVNSFLQLWFHNPDFRKAIYDWLPCDDPAEKENSSLEKLYDGGYVPVSPIGQLQLLFALMQFSKRSCVNPTSFIGSLGLDTTTQQDAQEFSKLFVSMLEERLLHQSNPQVSNMVQQLFRGQVEYVTKCCKCQTESSRPSQFYELDLSLGSKTQLTLAESISSSFLHEEKLEGTDQYFCSNCGSKQNATRNTRLQTLPPVLNIQLLRFVFDRKTGHKKKVSSSVHFPEVLEMDPYVHKSGSGTGPNELTYDLAAVLIHRGPSAYSGHYVAHIRDPVSGAWHKFNDDVVQKLEGKKLKLGAEDELEESKKGRTAVKVAKGVHASSNAYMLVYCRRSNSTPPTTGENGSGPKEDISILPSWAKATVDCENYNFEAWTRDISQRKDHNLKMSREKRDIMTQMYNHLPCDPASSEGDFISTAWLSSWLSDQNDLGPVHNDALLCSHGRVNPEKYKEFKFVSSSVADALYDQYHGGPRLKRDSLCWDCVRAKCTSVRLKTRLDADSKSVTNLLKNKIEPSETSYWVGKDSLRSWKRLVLERLNQASSSAVGSSVTGKNCSGEDHETDIPNDPDVSMEVATKSEEPSDDVKVLQHKNGTINGKVDTNGLGGSTQWQEEFLKTLDERPKSADSTELGFNDDLLCSHGNLCVEEGPRRLVQSAVWDIFVRYFPEAPEFKSTNPPCELCSRMAYEEVQTRETNKKMAMEQRQVLADLFRSKNRPVVSRPSFEQAYILTRDIVDKWRAFIRDPARREPVTSISNSSLLCPHGGLLHRPSDAEDEADNKFVLLSADEWDKLVKFVDVDTAVVIRKSIVNGGVSLQSDPAVCETCLLQRLEEERLSQLVYQKATIYVRQICPNDKNASFDADGPSPFVSSPVAAGSAATESGDPDFYVGSGCKKPRLEPGVMQSPVMATTPTSSASRRSQRQRRVRGEKEIVVSSDQKLRDLKVEIMKKFRIPPFDQHLICNGRDLSDNQASLAALGIYPGTVIYLQADEPSEDPSMMEDYARTAVPEEGFKGTELLRN